MQDATTHDFSGQREQPGAAANLLFSPPPPGGKYAAIRQRMKAHSTRTRQPLALQSPNHDLPTSTRSDKKQQRYRQPRNEDDAAEALQTIHLAVTMSEEDDEEDDNSNDGNDNDNCRQEEDEKQQHKDHSYSWAMMDHYCPQDGSALRDVMSDSMALELLGNSLVVSPEKSTLGQLDDGDDNYCRRILVEQEDHDHFDSKYDDVISLPSEPTGSEPPHPTPSRAFSTFRQNSTHMALSESQVYLDRIRALEQALDAAQAKVAKTAALSSSSSHATVDADTVWERNQTLVKEVRFADQTCVELAGQKAALEQQVDQLQEQLAELKEDKHSLSEDLKHAQWERAVAESQCETLTSRLQETAVLEPSLHEQEDAARKDEIKSLKADLRKAHEAAERAQQMCHALQSRLEESESARQEEALTQRRQADLLDKAFQDKQTFEQELDRLQHQVDSERAEFDADRTEWEADKAEWKKTVVDAQSDMTAVQEELDETRDSLDTWQDRYHMDRATWEAERATLTGTIADSEGLMREVQGELASSRDNLDRAHARCDRLESKLAESDSEKAKLSQVTAASNTRLSLVQEELDKRRDELDRSRALVNVEREQKVAVETGKQHLLDELVETQDELEQLKAHSKEEKTRVLQVVRTALAGMVKKTASLDATMMTETTRLSDRIDSLADTMEYITEAFEFEPAEMSTLFPDQSVAPSTGSALNATFAHGVNRTVDLEQMEEARSRKSHSTSPSQASARKVTDETTTPIPESLVMSDMSTLAGISHLFSDGMGQSPNQYPSFASRINASTLDKFETSSEEPWSPIPKSSYSPETRVAREDVRGSVDTVMLERNRLEAALADKTCLLETTLAKVSQLEKAMSEQVQAQSRSLETMRSERDDCKRELAVRDTELKETHAKLRDLEEAGAKLRVNIQQLKDERQQLQLTNLRLTDEVAEIVRDNQSSPTLETIRVERDNCKHELALRSLELQEAQSELADLQVNCKQLTQNVAQLRSKNQSLTTELSDREEQHALSSETMRAERDDCKRDLAVRNLELQETQSQLLHLETAGIQLRQNMTQLKDERQQLQSEVQRLTAELEKKNAILSEHAKAPSAEEIEEHVSSHYRDDIVRLQEVLCTTEANHNQLQGAFAACNEQLASLMERNSKAESEANYMSKMQAAAEDLASSTGDRLIQAQRELKEVRGERDELEQEQGQLKHKLDIAKTRIATLEEAVLGREELQETLARLKTDRDQLEKDLQSKTASLAETEQEYHHHRASTQEEKAALRLQIEGLDQELQATRASFEELQASYLNCNEQLANLVEANTHNEGELLSLRRTLEATEDLATDAEERFLKANSELESARIERDDLLADRDDLQDTVTRSKENIRLMTTRIEEKERSIQALASERDSVTSDASLYRKQLQVATSELESKQAALDKLRVDMKEYNEDLAKQEMEMETLLQSFKDTSDALQAARKEASHAKGLVRTSQGEAAVRTSELETKCQRLRDYARKLGSKCDEWEAYYDEQANCIERLRKAHVRTRQQAVEVADRYQQQDQEFSEQRSQWTAERSGWNQHCHQLESELDAIAKTLSQSVRP